MKSCWISVGPKSSDPGSLKDEERTQRDTKRGGCVKTDAEIGVTWPQAKEHLRPPEAGRGRKDLPQSLRREH